MGVDGVTHRRGEGVALLGVVPHHRLVVAIVGQALPPGIGLPRVGVTHASRVAEAEHVPDLVGEDGSCGTTR